MKLLWFVLFMKPVCFPVFIFVFLTSLSCARMKNPAIVGVLCTDAQGHNLGCKYS